MANWIDPDNDRFSQFKNLPRDQPIHMLNLVRLRETAVYDDGREVSGRQAYGDYSRESSPVFEALGGRIVWSGSFELMLIGPAVEYWDLCFIAQYPDGEAFISMLRDETYRRAVKHRQAAVADSRLIRLTPGKSGKGFG